MYSEAPNIEAMANKIIDSMEDLCHIRKHHLEIAYLYCYKEKKKGGYKVMADITEVRNLLSYYCDYDFIVTVYEPNIIDLTEAQLQLLIYHELLHIGDDCKLRGHDIMDFKAILMRYGVDWMNDKSLSPIVGGEKVDKKKKGNKNNGSNRRKQTSKKDK